MRIGIFGGSFDPVHTGHLIVAEAAADLLDLDQVRFIPAREHPFKTEPYAAGIADRLEMLERALRGNPRFVLDTAEIDRPGKSYTFDTLVDLRDRFPEDQLFLMVGADAARDIMSWHNAERLSGLAEIVAMSRAKDSAAESEFIDRCLEVPSIEISASGIRRTRAAGRSIRYCVPREVLDYIEARRLYASEAECSNKSSQRS